MFRGRLALALNCTLEELGRRVSFKELAFWRKFDALCPIGDVRMDRMAAMICRTIARMAGVTVDSDAYEPQWGQWLIDKAPETWVETQDQIKAAFKAVFSTKKPVDPPPP